MKRIKDPEPEIEKLPIEADGHNQKVMEKSVRVYFKDEMIQPQENEEELGVHIDPSY